MRFFTPFFLSFLLAGTSLFAKAENSSDESTRPSSPKVFQGPFIGASFGYGGNLIRSNLNVPYLGADAGVKTKMSAQGFDEGVMIGYSHIVWGNWGTGIQANFNWAHIQGSIIGNHTPTTPIRENFLLKNAVQVRVPVFYVVNNSVAPKMFVGWDSSYWSTTVNLNYNAVNLHNKSRYNGVLWGCGVDFLADRNIIFGLEYAGIFSQNKILVSPNSPANTSSVRPEYHTFKALIKLINSPEMPAMASGKYAFRETSPKNVITPKAFQGVYFGLNAGYGASFVRYYCDLPSLGNGVYMKTKTSPQGADGGFILGCHHIFENRLGTGLETCFNLTSVSGKIGGSHSTTLPFIAKSDLKNSFQIRIPLSYVIAPRVAPKIYTGWDNSYWSSKVTFNNASGSLKKRYNGVLWGVGVDFLIAEHMISGIEYTGVISEKKTITSQNPQDSYKIHPTYQTIKATLKVIY